MTAHFDVQDLANLRQGWEHFRTGDYFAAHDDWEAVWQGLHGRRRLFWQAMIQLAVGSHHWRHGNRKGCLSVWHKALQKCDDLAQLDDTEVPTPLIRMIDLLYECITTVEQGGDPVPILTSFAASARFEQWLTFA
jgi:hypothetical protein